jgi:hypothetical protein
VADVVRDRHLRAGFTTTMALPTLVIIPVPVMAPAVVVVPVVMMMVPVTPDEKAPARAQAADHHDRQAECPPEPPQKPLEHGFSCSG